MPKGNLILILDTETTGNEAEDEIIEIGMVMLDSPSLNEIGSFTAVIKPSAGGLQRLLDKAVVKAMHEKNGLLSALDSGLPSDIVDSQIVRWLSQYSEDTTHIPFGGSGVLHFDRQYIRKGLPRLDKRITYWALDVGVARRIAAIRGYKTASIDAKDHRALQDARVHADELRFYVDRFRRADEQQELEDQFAAVRQAEDASI